MSSPIGMAEYFAMEAGEYLDRLAALVGKDGPPQPEELVRFARALRGSALMANQPVIARSAAGLEAVAKAYRESRRPWDAPLKERCAQAIVDLKTLVKTAGSWSDEEGTRAERLALDLESLGGVASPAGPRPTPPSSAAPGTDAGVRAFVAREGALTASALDRAARALRSSPEAHDPLYAVLRRLQSLRGLAALTDLAPLPDVLESVERAVGELTRMFAPPPQVADVFEAAAQALARCARDVAQSGKSAPDAEEARRFAELLLKAFATENDVVSIETLYIDGEKGILQSGTSLKVSPLSTVELVSQGERLCEVADELERAETPTLRDLRLYSTVAALRPLETAVGEQVPASLGAFAGAARELIAQGGVARNPEEFADCVRQAGGVLRGIGSTAAGRHPSDEIEALAQRLHKMGAPVFRPVYPTPVPPVERPVERISTPVPEPAVVVPIETLLVEEPRRAVPQAPKPVPAAEPGLAGSFATLHRLISERGLGAASLDELMAGPAIPPAVQADGDIIDISMLCYRGPAALERAAVVRRELNQVLGSTLDQARLRSLIDELVDLVSLAAEPS
jgi:hypothetical protein